jgi:4-amino-4-deoxy-L-arabinose transferase-like glycosyltransferase
VLSLSRPAVRGASAGLRSTWFWLAALAVACLWFGTLDARHLLRSDEGRYAEIAREMFASGDWVTIRYNGLKYFEKPPFHLWMTALAYEAFGVGDWQARLWVACSGAIGTLATMLAAQRWFGTRVGLLSGLVLMAMPTWNLGAHFNSLDMSVTGALAVVLAATLIAQHPQTVARGRWMALAWAAMGVAVLTKGLIGIVLPGLALVLYTLGSRDWAVWRRLHIIAGSVVLLAITVPWFWLVADRNPEFLRFFFIHEHFQRYTSGVHQRGAPWWFFVPQLLVGLLPWLALWPGMAVLAWREPKAEELRPLHLLAAWAVAIFVFFSASGSKLPGYILPVLPALAVLAALALDRLSPRAWGRCLVAALVVAVALTLASPRVAQMSNDTTPQALFAAYAPWLTAAGALLVAGVLAAWALHARELRLASMAAYALGAFAAATVALLGHETLGRSISGVDLVPPIQAQLKPGMPIYGVRLLDHTLPFYLRRTLVMVEEPDELEFGTQQEPQKWLPTLAAFDSAWRSGAPALALMSHETHAMLQARQLPMTLVVQDPRRVVVANFSPAR